MRSWRTVSIIAALATAAACGGSDGYLTTGGDGGGGGNGGGGAVGTVTIGSGIQYVSGHNATMNPAVDTIVAGATVTWTWTGALPHGVRSVGTPSFTSSPAHTGSGTYSVTFTNPGTYQYDCSVHGQAMTGRIVVLPSTSPSSGGAYDATATADDPAGDTFGAGAKWDVTRMTLAHQPNLVTVMLDFSRDVVPPTTGDASALLAFVDLDLDQNVSTGSSAMADEFRQDSRSTTLGGDDGFVSAAAIVGVAGAPSDIVPQVGHLAMNQSNPNADRASRPAVNASLISELAR